MGKATVDRDDLQIGSRSSESRFLVDWNLVDTVNFGKFDQPDGAELGQVHPRRDLHQAARGACRQAERGPQHSDLP